MVAILFEGKTDKNFLDSILKNYNLPKDKVIYYNFDGKDNIFNIGIYNYDELEKNINVELITKMLIVVDADNPKDPNPNRGYNATERKLQEIIEDLGFDIPIDYYIMCDENQEGYLESFLLSVVDDEQKECIETFKSCFKYNLSDKWVYNSFYKHNKYPFDFNHENFDILKKKLEELFN